ncbi:MAG: hypothetical protein LBQ00_05365 [Syntrophobacterales bacterium]|nr:hypothetical protein [Syntrophobacterales bacterium]
MAKEVAANAELLTIIPSNIVKNAAFPLELDDLYKLYATNETITSDDEGALEFDIPSPAEFAF